MLVVQCNHRLCDQSIKTSLHQQTNTKQHNDTNNTQTTKQKVSPITIVKSDMRLDHTRSIAVNATYVCYGLKLGQVRVINKATVNKALFKGHAAPLSELAAELTRFEGVENFNLSHARN